MHPSCRFKSLLLFLLPLFFYSAAFSQKNILIGTITDTVEKKKLHLSIVALIGLADTTLYTSVRSAANGAFAIEKIPPGRYRLMVSHPKMADYLQELTIKDTSKIDLKEISLVPVATLLEEVVVRSGYAIRMRGDTLEYNADSFAVRPGANVAELLKRLPGIQVERSGKIIAQGREVKRVLVDGDEFFSDDPALAAKYLNADAIAKVQVYDGRSEQSRFTGIDDGQRTKTINLELKKSKKNGYFGKLSAGADGSRYHHHEAMGALFNGGRKVSVFALSSKTGKEGLSSNELSKYTEKDREQIDDRTGMVVSTEDYVPGFDNEHYYGSGLPSVTSGGAHYSDKWNAGRQTVFGNYRIKQINASGWNNSSETSVLPDGRSFREQSEGTERSFNLAQKASGSFSSRPDSFSMVRLTADGHLNRGDNTRTTRSGSVNEKGYRVNNSARTHNQSYAAQNFGSGLSYQRRSRREGRTLSFQVQQEYSGRNGEEVNFSENNYFDPESGTFKSADTLNQVRRNRNGQESYAARLAYTEAISKKAGLSVEYGYKWGGVQSDFSTFNNNGKDKGLIDSLSNDYRFITRTHITGANFTWNHKQLTLSAGSKVYVTGMEQENREEGTNMRRRFTNLAPAASANMSIKNKSRLFFNYSGATFQPAVNQLQPLRKSTSQLYVQVGNPDLRPGFQQSASLGFNRFGMKHSGSFSVRAGMNHTGNNITMRTFTDVQGRTVSQYINMNGIPGFNGSLNYSWRYGKYRLNPSVSSYVSRFAEYSVLNDRKVRREFLYGNTALNLNWDWKNRLALAYMGNISFQTGRSDINGTNRTLSHGHSINATVFLPKKFEIGSDCNLSLFPRIGSFNNGFNRVQWNGFMQKKFLKKENVQVRWSVNDLLNSNTGYSRGVYGGNVNEYNSSVLKRYWLLSVTWNFSKSI